MLSVIDAYISELDGRLRGPRRVKADLLAEARDSLIDAASAYESHGWAREAAERRAVGEFGEVDAIAPDYQVELGLAQGRRTASLVLVVMVAQPLIWGHGWRWVAQGWQGEAGPGYALLDQAVNWLGAMAIVGALFATLACGVGVRYLGEQRRVIRYIAVFAYVVCGVFALSGVVLALLSPQVGLLLSMLGLVWLTLFLVIPFVGIGVSARRCLVAA